MGNQDALYEEAAGIHGAALERLARAYERDADKCRDLLQEIHVALWRSFASYEGRCSLRTWVYRVAHNTAASQISRRLSNSPTLVSLDELERMPAANSRAGGIDGTLAFDRILELIQQLKPLDRQVILLYLEGMEAISIGEITGLSASNVATKVHRIKNVLTRRFHQGERT